MRVTYIDHMGTDLSVVNAARVSFGKKSTYETTDQPSPGAILGSGDYYKVLKESDQRLIQFLARGCTSGDWEQIKDSLCDLDGTYDWECENMEEILRHVKNMPTHWTPFAHTAITLHIKAPIFIARQLGKHQVGMVWNEVSRRYVTDEPEFYRFPEYRLAAPNVKQGSSEKTLVPKGQEGRCPQCGESFEAKSNRTYYCSSKCQSKGWRSTPEGWKLYKWSKLKQSSEKRGFEFSITPEDIPTPTHCIYLGKELKYDNTELRDDSASVDRIDNSLGYIPGNLQTISNQANTMKGVASEDEIVAFSKASLLIHGNFMVPQVDSLDMYYDEMERLYKHLVEDQKMCAEQARGFMPQTMMTEWYWTGNLYSFANVFIQRSDSHAQKEVQEVAKQIGEIIEPLFPVSWKALIC